MKEYEESFDKPLINLQAIFFILLIFGIVIFYASPMIFKKSTEKIEITKCESTAIQIEYITILVTPTPDGKIYFASEYQEGIRKIQNPFSFYSDNASGYKRMMVRSFVYDYKVLDYLTWYNDNDAKDYRLHPHTGYKFLVVYYAMYLDDRIADDTRYHIPSKQNFIVQSVYDNSKYYLPYEIPTHFKYLELEYSKDFDNREYAQYFGQHTEYSRNIDNRLTAGIVSVPDTVLYGGKSNCESGYIIYEIPNTLTDEELLAGIHFGKFGTAYWKLKP